MARALREIFIQNLKYYRKQKGLTQEKLSEILNKGFNYINTIECGKSVPPIDMIEKIAIALEIPPARLLYEKGCPYNVVAFDEKEFINDISSELTEYVKVGVKEILQKKL